jgi:uncharacterized membrane protein
MRSLFLAVSYFVGIHLFISGTGLRDVIVGRTGEQRFLGLFSLLSLLGMVWMVWAYATSDLIVVWTPPAGLRWLAPLLTFVAFVFIVAGLTTLNPTVVGGEAALDAPDTVAGALRITRHPFLWGVALWALTHLLVNGDAASMILFGGLLALALIGPGLIDAKRRRRFGSKWEGFAARTSNVPFLAVAQGRNEVRLAEIGWWRVGLGAAVWLGLILIHPWLFGVTALPG